MVPVLLLAMFACAAQSPSPFQPIAPIAQKVGDSIDFIRDLFSMFSSPSLHFTAQKGEG